MANTAQSALSLLDKLLAERPDRVGHDFSEATRCIAAYRDECAASWRRSGSEMDRKRLDRVNAVLSVVVGGSYPLGQVPWDHIEKARAVFADVSHSA
jgi:formate dehydrogenase major subunit